MARKHNAKHQRSRSHYLERLQRRGQSGATVRMPDVEDLRKTQGARAARQGHPWPTTLTDTEDGGARS
jgi:hypothetical protein